MSTPLSSSVRTTTAKTLRLEDPNSDQAADSMLTQTSESVSDRSHSEGSGSNSDDDYAAHRRKLSHGGHDGSGSDNSDSGSTASEYSFGGSSSLMGDSTRGEFSPNASPTSQSVARIQLRRKMRQKKFVRKGQEGQQSAKDAFHVGTATRERDQADLKSYFHCKNCTTNGFSLRHEWRCFAPFVLRLWESMEEDRLPWAADFFALSKMRWPKNKKEALSRLNLNIPYYAANYVEIFYIATLPFLLFYNLPFLVVLLVSCVLLHSIGMRQKELNRYDTEVTILGYSVTYHTLGHTLLLCNVVLFMFFNGLRTVTLVLLLNAALILPHALWRRTTFFDDEEMEKCRPKLVQYALMLVFLALCYLEGATDHPDERGDSVAKRDGASGGDPPAAAATEAGATSSSSPSPLVSNAVMAAAVLASEDEAGRSHLLAEIEREKLGRQPA